MASAASKFTKEERSMLITLPWLAGAAVSLIDTVGGAKADARETDVLRGAVSRNFLAYQVHTGENLSGEPDSFDFDQAPTLVIKACQDALALLEKKDTPENIDRYKTVVLDVAYSVAAAFAPGFMGRGEKVSQEESGMVSKIAEALKATHLLEAVKKG